MSGYQIGVTPANMVDLTDLGLPDPLWDPLSDFTPFTDIKRRGTGEAVGLGLPRFAWRFNELTIAQMGVLLYYVTTGGNLMASKTVYVRTRVPVADMTDRVFQSFEVYMMLPLEPREAQYTVNRRYRDVTISFIQAEAL